MHINKNVYMPGTGCEVDFVAYGENNQIEHVESKGGKKDDRKRPGAQRTDNVKKAVANGALIKAKYPDIKYVVYFSAKPITNSYSDQMIDTALCYKIIDEVRYIKYNNVDDSDLLLFVMPEQATGYGYDELKDFDMGYKDNRKSKITPFRGRLR